ncbi:MAG TPA: PAS domain-containing protein, partial [Polyangiaceae bacterium]
MTLALDDETELVERSRRVRWFAAWVAGAYAFHCVVALSAHRPMTSRIDACGALSMLAVAVWARTSRVVPRFVVEGVLVLNGTLVGLAAYVGNDSAAWYFAGLPLIAAYLVSLRAALVWGAVALLASVTLTFALAEPIPREVVETMPDRIAGRSVLVLLIASLAIAAQRTSDARARALLALQAQHGRQAELYRTMVTHLPDGAVCMVDRGLRYVSAEGPALPATLRDPDTGSTSLAGQRVGDVVGLENRELLLAVYKDVLAGATRHAELRNGRRVYEVRAVPLRAGGEIYAALALLHDVTERSEADRLKREFISTV